MHDGTAPLQVEYAGVNFADTLQRAGNYVAGAAPPFALGAEAAGTIVALPADQSLLEDASFKERGLSVGARVVIVRTAPIH